MFIIIINLNFLFLNCTQLILNKKKIKYYRYLLQGYLFLPRYIKYSPCTGSNKTFYNISSFSLQRIQYVGFCESNSV